MTSWKTLTMEPALEAVQPMYARAKEEAIAKNTEAINAFKAALQQANPDREIDNEFIQQQMKVFEDRINMKMQNEIDLSPLRFQKPERMPSPWNYKPDEKTLTPSEIMNPWNIIGKEIKT